MLPNRTIPAATPIGIRYRVPLTSMHSLSNPWIEHRLVGLAEKDQVVDFPGSNAVSSYTKFARRWLAEAFLGRVNVPMPIAGVGGLVETKPLVSNGRGGTGLGLDVKTSIAISSTKTSITPTTYRLGNNTLFERSTDQGWGKLVPNVKPITLRYYADSKEWDAGCVESANDVLDSKISRWVWPASKRAMPIQRRPAKANAFKFLS